ncbi:hypothetical protein ABS232_02140 [Acinetobacter baumannii]|uniref:hypothetical protein n=1 Tax=Acinetobacter baumannii TaxID=470 RepID=UPI0033279544
MDKFEEYYKNSEWFGTYESDLMMKEAFEAGQQSMQAKVEELKASHHGEVIGHEVHFKKIKQERDELQTLYTQQGINMLKLQKRVDAATKQAQNALQYVEEDMRGNHEFLQMAMIRTFKDLEQALKGEGQ